jgi:hypothetical protein
VAKISKKGPEKKKIEKRIPHCNPEEKPLSL